MNSWHEHLMKYKQKHPNLSLKECMKEASKTYKKKGGRRKKGGNPLATAAVGEAVKAIPGTINAIGDQIDQGRKTQHQFNKENGALSVEKNKNLLQYYRDLQHKRFWDQEYLPPTLRLERTHTNNSKYKNEQDQKNKLLWEYAKNCFS